MRLRTSNFHEALTEITAVPYPPPAKREGNAWLALLALIAKGEVFFRGFLSSFLPGGKCPGDFLIGGTGVDLVPHFGRTPPRRAPRGGLWVPWPLPVVQGAVKRVFYSS